MERSSVSITVAIDLAPKLSNASGVISMRSSISKLHHLSTYLLPRRNFPHPLLPALISIHSNPVIRRLTSIEHIIEIRKCLDLVLKRVCP